VHAWKIIDIDGKRQNKGWPSTQELEMEKRKLLGGNIRDKDVEDQPRVTSRYA
jgi:hypothetical protein